MIRKLLACLALLFLPSIASAQQWLPGAAGSPIVCAYNATPPAVASGLFVYAQCDANGNLTGGGGGGGGGAVTAAAGAYVSGSIVDLGPFTAAFDSLPTPTGSINDLNALVSIYETLQNAGKIVGSVGSQLDAAPGSDAVHAIATQGVTGMKPVIVGGTYNTTVPAPTNGTTASFQIDQNSFLRGTMYSACTGVINISQTATTDLHTFTGIGHICAVMIVSDIAQKIGIQEGTGTTCQTSGTALAGVSATASNTAQISLSANGGFTIPGGFTMTTSGDHLCLDQSAAGQLGGIITYIDLAH
jgi:hypothetical protein